jgi:uncharacterized protein YifE (UPF0438 family)
MQDPKDHADFLARHDYPVAAVAQLTEEQRHLLTRYGHWLKALAEGTIEPATADQQHFVRAVRGDVAPQSAFEVAWIEHRRASSAPPRETGLAATLARVEAARLAVAAATDEYEMRRAEILQRVQDDLDALEVAFATRVEPLRQASERAEQAARAAVLAYGASFRYGRVQAVYARGRITWDTKGLTQYLESHPEVARYRRIGQPSVSFRLRPPEPPDSRGPDFEE